MPTIWCIHNDVASSEVVDRGYVSIGWHHMPDLTTIADDRVTMREAVANAYSHAKPGAVPVWAGMMLRFAYRVSIGDLVIAPNRLDSTLNFGRISGEYEYHPELGIHPHIRKVTWLKTGVTRSLFSQTALYEVGGALTLFQIKTHAEEFLRFLAAESEESFAATAHIPQPQDEEAAETAVADDPNADRIQQFTRDFVANRLLTGISHEAFEHFTADLLRCMGYQARVTQYSADGGVDVIAHRDPLGLEPPIIKVQCKHTAATQGKPEVQRLIGTLAPNEVGLFVTLGSYSREARDLERERQTLRLFSGSDLTDLVLEHYSDLPSQWRDLIPLRPVLVVDRDPEAG